MVCVSSFYRPALNGIPPSNAADWVKPIVFILGILYRANAHHHLFVTGTSTVHVAAGNGAWAWWSE